MFCMRTAGKSRIASARQLFVIVLLSFAASLTSNSGVAQADFRPFWEKSEPQKAAKRTYSRKKAGYQKRKNTFFDRDGHAGRSLPLSRQGINCG